MQKNRTKSSFFLSVLLKILLREVIRPILDVRDCISSSSCNTRKKTKKKKLIIKREKTIKEE